MTLSPTVLHFPVVLEPVDGDRSRTTAIVATREPGDDLYIVTEHGAFLGMLGPVGVERLRNGRTTCITVEGGQLLARPTLPS